MDTIQLHSSLKQATAQLQTNLAKIKDIEQKISLVNTLTLKDTLQQKYNNLFNENLCLNQLIKDYEQCLELIMLKFRLQSQKLLDIESKHNSNTRQLLDEFEIQQSALEKENLQLREMLGKVCGILRGGLGDDTLIEKSMQELVVENDTFRTLLGL